MTITSAGRGRRSQVSAGFPFWPPCSRTEPRIAPNTMVRCFFCIQLSFDLIFDANEAIFGIGKAIEVSAFPVPRSNPTMERSSEVSGLSMVLDVAPVSGTSFFPRDGLTSWQEQELGAFVERGLLPAPFSVSPVLRAFCADHPYCSPSFAVQSARPTRDGASTCLR